VRLYGKDHVHYVRNITDIDDKIINRANENGEAVDTLTERFINEMNHDADALGVLHPNEEPRATRHMDDIIAMIQQLIDNGYAYVASNQDVYYDVGRFEAYGRLSGKNIEDLRAGERVEITEAKRDPLDFVLWKAAKPNEPSWDSPWGKGRPGWHIECSAMSTHCLGNHFDIHGGGLDLQFPHHENEIAQSEASTGEKFVNVWMHNGHVRVDNEKMSKSLGNFFTIREVLKQYHPEVLRFFILSSHYRSPLNYSDQHLENAKASLTTLYTALRGLQLDSAPWKPSPFTQRFMTAMDDDFNTPKAIAVLFEMAGDINRYRTQTPQQALAVAKEMQDLAGLLGFLQLDADEFLQGGGGQLMEGAISNEAIADLISQRNEARKNKNFAESDRIRDELAAQGIVLEDGSQGTTWRRE
jgi:cysteinyl-tRNA synthetase